jgi:hypothetical protein
LNISIIQSVNLAMAEFAYREPPKARRVHSCVPLPRPDRQIRVLDLDPVFSESPSPTEALHGTLRAIGEPENHEYTALSYIWAQSYDPSTPERENRLTIHCDSDTCQRPHEARIGPNCWSALWNLCKTQGGKLTIWVDSVCIDLTDDDEVDQQMSLVRDIYKSAQKTFFWLGEATKNTDQAMELVSLHPATRGPGAYRGMLLLDYRALRHAIEYQPYPPRSGLRDMRVFGRQWVKRLSELQECIVSEKGVVMRGDKSVPLVDLTYALLETTLIRHHFAYPTIADG